MSKIYSGCLTLVVYIQFSFWWKMVWLQERIFGLLQLIEYLLMLGWPLHMSSAIDFWQLSVTV